MNSLDRQHGEVSQILFRILKGQLCVVIPLELLLVRKCIQGNQNLGSILQKSSIEIDHSEKAL